ncbi:MAG: hypothetical protein QOG77_1198, partial [Solirubrobacteraceae bacterium]|nr:hypothetical protein [Solirubrobacteraceae bacterium]
MKRIISVAAATLLTMAAPASAATSATGVQPATGDVPATLDATIPTTGVDFGSLTLGAAGTESGVQTLDVSSNQAWGATLSGDHTNMTKYTAVGAYEPLIALASPFQWQRTTQTATSHASIQT